MKRLVLVVDDNVDDSNMLAQVVELICHHKAVIASDGAQAIRLAEENDFDLVLLDLQLPVIQGQDVAKSLRQMARYRHVPIIAITAHDETEARRQSLIAGCTVYLNKPIDTQALIDILEEHLPPSP
ncbi:MAG: response regulator [Anaerolineae bacterium]|nr:response regulator [Anaerolineae bacterium]